MKVIISTLALTLLVIAALGRGGTRVRRGRRTARAWAVAVVSIGGFAIPSVALAAPKHRFVCATGIKFGCFFIVPRSVNAIVVDAYGEQGGADVLANSSPSEARILALTPPGGKGAHVHARLPVKPGQRLILYAQAVADDCVMNSEQPGQMAAVAVSLRATGYTGRPILIAGGGGGSSFGIPASVFLPPYTSDVGIEGGAGGPSGAPGSPGHSLSPGRITGAPYGGGGGGAGTPHGTGTGGLADQSTLTAGGFLTQATAGANGMTLTGFPALADWSCGGVGASENGNAVPVAGTDGGPGGQGFHGGGGGGGGGVSALYDPNGDFYGIATGGGGGGGSSWVEPGAHQIQIAQGVHTGYPKVIIHY